MTVAELVTRALILAGRVGPNRAPTASEMTEGIETLNQMVAAWAIDGMDLGVAAMIQNQDVLIDEAYLRGVTYSLGVELAAAVDMPTPKFVTDMADSEQGKIRASLCDIDNLRCDDALIGRRYGFDHTTGQ